MSGCDIWWTRNRQNWLRGMELEQIWAVKKSQLQKSRERKETRCRQEGARRFLWGPYTKTIYLTRWRWCWQMSSACSKFRTPGSLFPSTRSSLTPVVALFRVYSYWLWRADTEWWRHVLLTEGPDSGWEADCGYKDLKKADDWGVNEVIKWFESLLTQHLEPGKCPQTSHTAFLTGTQTCERSTMKSCNTQQWHFPSFHLWSEEAETPLNKSVKWVHKHFDVTVSKAYFSFIVLCCS